MKRRVGVIVLIILIAVAAGVWWYLGNTNTAQSPSGIFASGFIEATSVSISSEVNGRIISITKDEGNTVKAGDSLVKLDDFLLKAQMQQSEAGVKVAQAGLEQATASRQQAMTSSEGAKKIWQNMLDLKNNPLEIDLQIAQAQSQLDNAEVALQFEKANNPYRGSTMVVWWSNAFAQTQRDGAQKVLQSLINIKHNPQSINSSVDQAFNSYQTSLASLEVADKASGLASKQVEQAQASLAVVQVQLNKTVLTSPISGIVTARNSEVGELAQPGIPILSVTDIGEVYLTAFVHENNLGQIKIGQEAMVSVDSFPGQSFPGIITYISHQMEFTPKNIRTVGDRETTVFAVKIKLPNPEQKLKSGMPAEARITP